MKTKLTFLLALTFLFLFSGSVYGEEEVKKEYWGNGKLKSEIHYKNGKQEGPRKEWYESGRKKLLKNYKNGKENGIWKEWGEDGKLTYEGIYIDGVEEIK
jgi:antitoxin component YwqK of YwqJK toxin-antitoxin module